jgi:hypothetical protein
MFSIMAHPINLTVNGYMDIYGADNAVRARMRQNMPQNRRSLLLADNL